MIIRSNLALVLVVAAVWAALAQEAGTARSFPTPEDAVRALIAAAKADGMESLLGIFGAEGKELVASPDAEVTRRNREVFAVAAGGERCRGRPIDRRKRGAEHGALTVPRLLFQDLVFAGTGRCGRGQELCHGRPDDRRLRARRVAGSIWCHRHHDIRRQSGRHPARERSRARDRHERGRNEDLRPR
jgi:hypothetical protein